MNPLRPLAALMLLAASCGTCLAQSPAGAAAPLADDEDKDGTTVMGDRESPIGLLIAPWREARPEADLDRPVRFLQEELIPLDAEVFRRQVEYYYTIAAHLRSRGVAGYAPDPVSISPVQPLTPEAGSTSPTTAPPAAQ